MPICDGATCNREIAWRMTNTALQMRTGNIAFSIDGAHEKMLSVLTAAKCWNINPPKRAVVFKNLCKTCWDKQAAAWGDVATYTTARAKTTPQGIYMQVMREDFQVNKAVSKEAILSCAVHELMHFWSYESTGIQAYNRRANVDWDELVADVMGYRTYKAMYHGAGGFTNYLTPYNTYCVAFEQAKTQFQNVFGRFWREENDRNRLPAPPRELIKENKQKNGSVATTKAPAADLLVKALQEYLFSWFFLGPQHVVSDGVRAVTIDAFLEAGNLSNMLPTGKVFEAYDGHNKSHAI